MSSYQKYNGSPDRTVLLAAFLVSFILLLSQRSGTYLNQAGQRAAEDAVSPIAGIVSYPLRKIEKFSAGIRDRRRAYEDNIVLREQISQLQDRQINYDALSLKVRRYEQILSVSAQSDIPSQKVVARAVSETTGPFVRSLLLNVGRENDISIGNPVMSPDGMIGHIIKAGRSSSRVLRLEDLNSRIPVINQRSEAKAILSGDNTPRPLLSFVQTLSDWQVGDRIVTSGDDGLLPTGLPIGTVVKRGRDVLRVKLYAENKPVDWVWVSPFRPIEAPLETDTPETDVSETDAPETAANQTANNAIVKTNIDGSAPSISPATIDGERVNQGIPKGPDEVLRDVSDYDLDNNRAERSGLVVNPPSVKLDEANQDVLQ